MVGYEFQLMYFLSITLSLLILYIHSTSVGLKTTRTHTQIIYEHYNAYSYCLLNIFLTLKISFTNVESADN